MRVPSPLEAAHPVVHWRLRGLRETGMANPDAVDRAERIATSILLLRPNAGEPAVRMGLLGRVLLEWRGVSAEVSDHGVEIDGGELLLDDPLSAERIAGKLRVQEPKIAPV